ncbi:hypothetical protein FNV43_RR11851 [Rhamnella rubrinervis]|uniref:EF-hand domain-containing protein n=1 Tax=Rhamnella rubrinervis TaxID=2594499 RepID=A0A8K0H6A4_9ROSA|nr:hypothetical protein FNV43_RR11851 [Rhamnella rubrinervis]
MAIKSCGVSRDGKRVMTVEEFEEWLMKKFDADKDGRISQQELKQIIHLTGGHLATWKSKHAIRSMDSNANGFIDGDEITNLIDFAKTHLGLKIVSY